MIVNLSEERRIELLEKLRKERELRRLNVRQGNYQQVQYDENLIDIPKQLKAMPYNEIQQQHKPICEIAELAQSKQNQQTQSNQKSQKFKQSQNSEFQISEDDSQNSSISFCQKQLTSEKKDEFEVQIQINQHENIDKFNKNSDIQDEFEAIHDKYSTSIKKLTFKENVSPNIQQSQSKNQQLQQQHQSQQTQVQQQSQRIAKQSESSRRKLNQDKVRKNLCERMMTCENAGKYHQKCVKKEDDKLKKKKKKKNTKYTEFNQQGENEKETELIWKRLQQDKRIAYSQREQQKLEIEQKKLEEITHQPQISQLSQQIAILKKQSDEPVENRLIQEGKQIETRRKQKIQQQEEEVEQQFTYKPDIEISQYYSLRNYPSTNETKPITERFQEITKRKQQVLQQLKQKLEQESDSYFQPKIDKQSKIIAEIKNDNQEPVEKRLFREDLNIKNKKKQLVQQQNYFEQIECTFQPNTEKTAPLNDALLKYLPPYSEGLEIQDRHKIFDEFKMQKIEQVKQNIEKECSFHPNIDTISQYLVESNQDRVKKFDNRLYNEEIAKRQNKKEELEEQYNSIYTYQPKINQKSKILAETKINKSLDDLAYDFEGKEHKETLKEKVNEEFYRECIFQPQINKDQQYYSVNSHYGGDVMTTINTDKIKKEKKINKIKDQVKIHELDNCEFGPKINKNVEVDKEEKLKNMKGIESFLRQKDLRKRQDDDKKFKQDQLYAIKYDPSKHQEPTVQKPFNLSNNMQKKSKYASNTKQIQV